MYFLVSTQTSHHTSNENWSCGSVSSSTSISILHNPAESDDDIDGQTTDGYFIILIWISYIN